MVSLPPVQQRIAPADLFCMFNHGVPGNQPVPWISGKRELEVFVPRCSKPFFSGTRELVLGTVAPDVRGSPGQHLRDTFAAGFLDVDKEQFAAGGDEHVSLFYRSGVVSQHSFACKATLTAPANQPVTLAVSSR